MPTDPAAGEVPERFAFRAFVESPDRAGLCRDLERFLEQRVLSVEDSQARWDTFRAVLAGLRGLGHDLWSVFVETVFSWDYQTRRPGAGLTISFDPEPFEPDSPFGAIAVKVAFEDRPQQ